MPKTEDYRSLQDELDTILSSLQQSELDIDEAVKLYERGQQVIQQLEKYLKTAENKITKLKIDFEGK